MGADMVVPKLEKMMGIYVYATSSSGIGGVIRESDEDFVVEEVLVDGSKAEINITEDVSRQSVLGSSPAKNRYLLCILVKRNWDTFIALKNIAGQLGIKPSQIQIGGIKDAKALTAQHIAIEGVSAEDVQKVHVKDIQIRTIGYLRNKLSSYYLLGNNFHITIKAINHPKSTIQRRITKTIEGLEAIGGIPNFFGHQRFGTTRPITHLVGKAIVKGNARKAVMLFLAKPSSHEHPASRQAREELRATQDFRQALKNFPEPLRYERSMLAHLVERPRDFAGAFRRLPVKLGELFLQAYQSYLFNRFLSKRIENGLSLKMAETGDFVVNVERSGLPIVTMHKIVSAEEHEDINNSIKSGKMRLAIPLIGFKQHPSQGLQGEIEKQILEEEGLSPENFRTSVLPERSARGQLRAATTPLMNFSLNEISHNPIHASRHKAKVSFTLYRGSYATILLRELMKPRSVIEAGF
jgi:tRNA pseudouridine13 synthase